MNMTTNYNHNESELREQLRRDVHSIYIHFKILENQIVNKEDITACVIYKGKEVALFGSDFNHLRHAISNYDGLLSAFDEVKNRNAWSYAYSKKVYEKLNKEVNGSIYKFLSEWRNKVHEKHTAVLYKTAQTSMSTAGVLKNELKALVKKVLKGEGSEFYAKKLNDKYNVVNTTNL
jgi:hypothetical protein